MSFARTRLGVLALGFCVLGGGCLIPQDESYLSELPFPRNNPPRIVEKQVQPPDRMIRGYGTDRCSLEFSVIVEDPDLDDKISVQWYVDYDPSQPAQRPDAESTLAANDKPTRDQRATIKPFFNSAEFQKLNVPGDHSVEVLISDRTLQGREPQPDTILLADGEVIYNPGYTATYVWFVHTETGGTCP